MVTLGDVTTTDLRHMLRPVSIDIDIRSHTSEAGCAHLMCHPVLQTGEEARIVQACRVDSETNSVDHASGTNHGISFRFPASGIVPRWCGRMLGR